MGDTTIEWATKTWNPVTGCTPISPGCDHCYARRMAIRLRGRYGYPREDPFSVTLHPQRLGEPSRWRKPCRIFIASMGDLFHQHVPFAYLDRIFGVVADCPQHTYLVLTKRCRRMQHYMQTCVQRGTCAWPNLWCGTSVESWAYLYRLGELMDTAAAVRYVSLEPMLTPIDLSPWLAGNTLHWVIVGGETGPGARPMHPDWVRRVRDQCVWAGVPFFFKHWGGGKDRKRAGRLLDGQEWNQLPRADCASAGPT